jgi:hypothetical protein
MRVGPPLTMHLTKSEAAVLDSIAIQLYEAHPHDPRNEVDGSYITPGRAAAVRHLIGEALEDDTRPADWFDALRRMQKRLAAFWVREASWRRSNERTPVISPTTGKPSKPRPPWLRLLKKNSGDGGGGGELARVLDTL